MNLFLRLLISVLILCWLVPLFYGSAFFSTLPLRVIRDDANRYVIAKHPDLPLPDGLQVGDLLDLPRMSMADRVAAVQIANSPPGLAVNIAVLRDGQPSTITVTTTPDQTRGGTANIASGYPAILSLVALALITLWRGRDWTAWGLLLFAALTSIQNLVSNIPLDPITGFWLTIVATLLQVIAISGLYITGETLVGDGISARVRWRFRVLLIASCSVALVMIVVRRWVIFVDGNVAAVGWLGLTNLPLVIAVGLSVTVLAVGYRASAAAQKLRIRWVLFSTSLLLLTVCAQILFPQNGIGAAIVYGLLTALCMFGYLYAVLRHRLVDVSFIIDRTLVFGFTTALVVSVFALLEKIVESFALGKDASISLQAGVTLVIALVLNRVHHRVEHAVDRYVFRRQHFAIAALRGFTRECAFIEKYPRLLELSVERVQTAIGGTGVAIYDRRAESHDCEISCGSTTFPGTIENDDAALVAMRATQHHIETPYKSSVLDFEGYVFPITQRDRVIGVLMCGARHGEKLAPDELEALDLLAREIGRAIYDIRMREYERFLTSLAADRIANPGEQARRLAQSGHARLTGPDAAYF
ncbi:GAF domain-containing protein [Pseudolysobacter antarcticus]|uniref:GAF domain-containing protein n=1 Tax=Pseudolysobacter antarcticus TaxID=2511995 RepID=A0A411HL87_9GAMM|nr:GAF domain-containing protein [Pseudolysobacter antarcticus]QBB71261.1 GAF domain-containing protein [Pseudolysobacter antarcticus]